MRTDYLQITPIPISMSWHLIIKKQRIVCIIDMLLVPYILSVSSMSGFLSVCLAVLGGFTRWRSLALSWPHREAAG